MRVLAVLLVLFSVPALVIPALAQQPQQQQQQPSGPGSGSQTGPQRYPGDYCTRHCRPNETPCGDECLAPKGGGAPKCTKKVTTTCPGKP